MTVTNNDCCKKTNLRRFHFQEGLILAFIKNMRNSEASFSVRGIARERDELSSMHKQSHVANLFSAWNQSWQTSLPWDCKFQCTDSNRLVNILTSKQPYLVCPVQRSGEGCFSDRKQRSRRQYRSEEIYLKNEIRHEDIKVQLTPLVWVCKTWVSCLLRASVHLPRFDIRPARPLVVTLMAVAVSHI